VFAYTVRRVLGCIPVLLGVSLVVFVALRMLGDPVSLFLPPEATHEDLVRLRAQLGLDKPLLVQYLIFLRDLMSGSLGRSWRHGVPALQLLVERIPATLLLTFAAEIIAVLVAVPMGVAAATRRNTPTDRLICTLSFVGQSIPVFWLGVMLIILFAVTLGWLPTSGSGTPAHFVLPCVTLATWPIAQFTRLCRSELLDVLGMDYIRTARAKGLGPRLVLYRHALKNAAIPLVTMIGLNTGYLLGGAILTETIYAWPGVGRLLVQAILGRDFPVVQGTVLFVALCFVLVNLVVDLIYGILDPRIKLS